MVHAQAKFDGSHWLLRWNGIWCESGSIALVHRSIQSALKMTSISSVCYQVDGDVPVHRHRIVHWNGVWLVSKVDNGCKNAKYSLQNWSSHWHNTVKRIKSSITCGARKKRWTSYRDGCAYTCVYHWSVSIVPSPIQNSTTFILSKYTLNMTLTDSRDSFKFKSCHLNSLR